MIMSIIRSSEKPTTTATITSKCAVQSHQKNKKNGVKVDVRGETGSPAFHFASLAIAKGASYAT